MRMLDREHSGLRGYLKKVGHKNWVCCHFNNRRYSMMTSNNAESMNTMNVNPRNFPITRLLYSYSHNIFQCSYFWILGIWESCLANIFAQLFSWRKTSIANLGSLDDQCFHLLASGSNHCGKTLLKIYFVKSEVSQLPNKFLNPSTKTEKFRKQMQFYVRRFFKKKKNIKTNLCWPLSTDFLKN